MITEWSWIPGHSAGPFHFGDSADSTIAYGLRKCEATSSSDNWETYTIPGFDSLVIVQEGKIEEVMCKDACEYQGLDLLGMSLLDMRELFGPEDEFQDILGNEGTIVYYDRLGLSLWVAEGIVTRAHCGPILEDEE